tara:strand:- start:771 stop:1085 length:315 start_codon:yes stop_codon:yes gene_type:complete
MTLDQNKPKEKKLTQQELDLKKLKEKYGTVGGKLDTLKPNSQNRHFDISLQDRRRLRKVVKAVHFKHYPTHMVTDKEADKLIEALGPKVAEDMIAKYIQLGDID